MLDSRHVVILRCFFRKYELEERGLKFKVLGGKGKGKGKGNAKGGKEEEVT